MKHFFLFYSNKRILYIGNWPCVKVEIVIFCAGNTVKYKSERDFNAVRMKAAFLVDYEHLYRLLCKYQLIIVMPIQCVLTV